MKIVFMGMLILLLLSIEVSAEELYVSQVEELVIVQIELESVLKQIEALIESGELTSEKKKSLNRIIYSLKERVYHMEDRYDARDLAIEENGLYNKILPGEMTRDYEIFGLLSSVLRDSMHALSKGLKTNSTTVIAQSRPLFKVARALTAYIDTGVNKASKRTQ